MEARLGSLLCFNKYVINLIAIDVWGRQVGGRRAGALLCHGWMDSHHIPPTGSAPSPSPACCPTAQPLKLLNLHPSTDSTRSAVENPTAVPCLGAPLPRDPFTCLEQTCQGQWGCISNTLITRLSGKDALQPYTKLNKPRAVLWP